MLRYAIAATDDILDKSIAITMRGSYESTIITAAELGYDAIEMNVAVPGNYDTVKLAERFEKAGVKCAAIGSGLALPLVGATLSDGDAADREKAKNKLREFIDMAAVLKSGVIVGQFKGRMVPFEEKSAATQRLKSSLTELGDYAGNRNVPLFLEAINMYFTTLLNSAAQMGEFVRQLNHPNILLHIDSHHMHLHDRSALAVIREYRNEIGYVHLSDSNRYPMGYGNINFAEYVTGLCDIGYSGYCTVEVIGHPTQREAAKTSIDYLKRLEELYKSKIN